MKKIHPDSPVLNTINSIVIFLSLFQTFGSQLQVILQKHLHSDTLARKVEPPFVQQPPHPGENTLCLGAGCWNTEILPCKPHKGWILLHSGPPPSQGIIVNGQGRLVSVPAGDKSSLMMISEYIRVYPINRDYSGPSERVRLVTCRLTCDYPTKEFHH